MRRTLTRLLARRSRVLVALLVAGVAAFHAGRLLHAERVVTGGEIGFPLDDSFIYLQYARAIAEGHPFVYTPGNAATTGATSLLYPLLLAPPHLLRLAPPLCIAWTFGLGFAAYALSALLMARLGARLGGVAGGALAAALFLMSPHLLWGYLSGMEIALYGTVLLATLDRYLRERAGGRFRSTRWWLFALAGARPEGAILAGLFGLLMLWDRVRASRAPNGPRILGLDTLLPFVAAALPFVVNLVVSGSIEATSSQAKSILAEPYPETRRTYLAGLPGIWRDIGKVYLGLMQLDGETQVPAAFAWVNGLGALLYAVLSFLPRRRPWPGGFAVLPVVLTGILVGSLPVYWFVHYFRYLQGVYPVVLLLFAAGWGRLAWLALTRLPRAIGVPAAAIAAAIPLAVWAPKLLPLQSDFVQLYAWNCENIVHQQVRTGRWIDANLPRDAIVGLNDAGAIAYYGRRQTVDLIGLTTAGYARVYRSGLGCLFEHVRREPPGRKPTYFAIYPDWFPYWPASGILGPEAFRAHLAVRTIAGGTDMLVYPASWLDVAATDSPVVDPPARGNRRLVDTIDFAWLPDEARHGWRAEPEAKDVLRQYAYPDRPTRPLTDGGRIVPGLQRFRVRAAAGRDLVLVLRVHAWYASRVDVAVDGRAAGVWSIPRSETAWIEPSFTIPGGLITGADPEITLSRASDPQGGNLAPFHLWVYQ